MGLDRCTKSPFFKEEIRISLILKEAMLTNQLPFEGPQRHVQVSAPKAEGSVRCTGSVN